MEEDELKNLLEFLKEKTEKHLEENPYNFLTEADLQAFLYGKISECIECENMKNFKDAKVKKGKNPIDVYILHCEYPRHLEVGDSLWNRGRYDIAMLRKPIGKEWDYVKDRADKYPVEVAFELKLVWSRRKVISDIEGDLIVFGWDDKKRKFLPNKKRKYPKFGVIFIVNLIERNMKYELKGELEKILNKKENYRGVQIPKIFIVYIEVDRYNKVVTNSFTING
ncbi:hypothetical protein B6U81_01080 [Thermoplasmatales archaeon ex4484_30]|nr:MAG: hypothetical protein B6U81_01080 [Thermoplasmatales archaeon ex4484_30]